MDLNRKAGLRIPDLSYKNYIVQKRTHGNGKPHTHAAADNRKAATGTMVPASRTQLPVCRPGVRRKPFARAGVFSQRAAGVPCGSAGRQKTYILFPGGPAGHRKKYMPPQDVPGKYTSPQRKTGELREDEKPQKYKPESGGADSDLIFLDLDETEPAPEDGAGESGKQTEKPARKHPQAGRRPHVFRAVLLLAACVLFLLATVGGIVYYKAPQRCVKKEITAEAGDACPTVDAFLNWECKDAYIVSGIDENTVLDHVTDYEVVIRLYHRNVTATLHVEDTVKPELETQGKTIMYGESFEIQDFVKSVSDRTDCEVAFKEQPDITGGGIYQLVLMATDEGGNVTEMPAQLEVLQDVTPPVIEGVKELSILVGESVSYKRDVTVTDDYDENVRLVVDNSEVDVDTPGDYAVIYRATDKYGNTAEVSTILHVRKPQIPQQQVVAGIPVTEEAVNAEADKILAAITNDSMTQLEVLRAIYDWCYNKIAYANGTPKTNWVEGAYCGIVTRRGDCYAYAMSAKCLLTRAGIVNLDIERIRVGNGMHFWNLVDIGEGWHHFDTCRRGDGVQFFYLTDAELMVYSDSHRRPEYPDGSHHYDRSLYPEIE